MKMFETKIEAKQFKTFMVFQKLINGDDDMTLKDELGLTTLPLSY